MAQKHNNTDPLIGLLEDADEAMSRLAAQFRAMGWKSTAEKYRDDAREFRRQAKYFLKVKKQRKNT